MAAHFANFLNGKIRIGSIQKRMVFPMQEPTKRNKKAEISRNCYRCHSPSRFPQTRRSCANQLSRLPWLTSTSSRAQWQRWSEAHRWCRCRGSSCSPSFLPLILSSISFHVALSPDFFRSLSPIDALSLHRSTRIDYALITLSLYLGSLGVLSILFWACSSYCVCIYNSTTQLPIQGMRRLQLFRSRNTV